jgi:hypothetical protein
MMNRQDQTGGQGSANLQAGRDLVVVHAGLSYAEAKQLFSDLFRDNFTTLAGEAKEIAKRRAEELVDEFLGQLEATAPEAVQAAQDPDFQYAIFTAEREYARKGGDKLRALLVDLLIRRASEPEGELERIVLDEAVETAPKLTKEQFDALSLIYVLRYTMNHKLVYLDDLLRHLRSLDGFCPPPTLAGYQHLEYARCASLGIGELRLEKILLSNYAGLLHKGMPAGHYSGPYGVDGMTLVIPSFHNPALMQPAFASLDVMGEVFAKVPLSDEHKTQLRTGFSQFLMTPDEVTTFLLGQGPELARLVERWNASNLKHVMLTSVGIAIGHANLPDDLRVNYKLSTWLT